MLTTIILDGKALLESPWLGQVLSLDQKNMWPVLEQAGSKFPLEKRLRGFRHPSTRIILAMRGKAMLGYVEYCRDWTDASAVYISSIQVATDSRGGIIFRMLIRQLLHELRRLEFSSIRAGVHRSNARIIHILRKMGFNLKDEGSPTSLTVSGTRVLLDRGWS